MDKDMKNLKYAISSFDAVPSYESFDTLPKTLEKLKQDHSIKLPQGYRMFIQQVLEKRGCQIVLHRILQTASRQTKKENHSFQSYFPLVDQVYKLQEIQADHKFEKNNIYKLIQKSKFKELNRQGDSLKLVQSFLTNLNFCETFLSNINKPDFDTAFVQSLNSELQHIAAPLSNLTKQILKKRSERILEKQKVEEQFDKIRYQFPQMTLNPNSKFTANFNNIKVHFLSKINTLKNQLVDIKSFLNNINSGTKSSALTDNLLKNLEDVDLANRLRNFGNLIKEADSKPNNRHYIPQNVQNRPSPHYQITLKTQDSQQLKRLQAQLTEKQQIIERLTRQKGDAENTFQQKQKHWSTQDQTYRAQLNKTHAQNRLLKQELENKTEKLKELSQHIKQAQSTLYVKKYQIQALSGDLKQYELSSLELNKKNKKQQKQFEIMETRLKEQEKELQNIKKQLSQVQKEKLALKQTIQDSQQKTVETIEQKQSSLSQQLQRLRNQLASKEQYLSDKKGKLTEMTQLLKEKTQNVLELEKKNNIIQEEKQGMKQQRDNLNERLQQIQEQIIRVKTQKQSIQTQLSQVLESYQKLNQDYEQLNVQFQPTEQAVEENQRHLQGQIIQLTSELESMKMENTQVHSQNNSMKEQIRTLKAKIQSMKSSYQQLQRLRNQLASKEQDLSAIKEKLAEMSKLLKEKAQNVLELEKKNNIIQEEKQGMKQQRDNLNEKLQQIQCKLLKTQHSQSQLKVQVSGLTSKLTETKNLFHSFQQKGKALQEQIAKVKNQKTVLQSQLLQMTEKYQKLNQDHLQIAQFEHTKQTLEDNQKHLQGQIIQLTSDLESMKMKNTQIQSENQSLKEQIKTVKAEIQSMKSSYQQLLNQKEKQSSGPNGMLTKANHAAIFQTQIFDDKPEQKQILIKHIEDYTGAKIIKSKLLYKYDPLNQTNLHKYLDNKKGLLCVTQTSKAILAAFYPGSLVEKTVMDEGGLIVSVTNDKSYKLFDKAVAVANNKSYRGMVYDQYFIIFGNSQVRLRSGTKDLFSNFGINNAYFDCKGLKADAILNDGAVKQTQFEFCEYYQVLFDEPK